MQSKLGRLATAAAISGTAEELSGGKFSNGAVTGAFVVMFNDLMHDRPGKMNLNGKSSSEVLNHFIEVSEYVYNNRSNNQFTFNEFFEGKYNAISNKAIIETSATPIDYITIEEFSFAPNEVINLGAANRSWSKTILCGYGIGVTVRENGVFLNADSWNTYGEQIFTYSFQGRKGGRLTITGINQAIGHRNNWHYVGVEGSRMVTYINSLFK